jgi:amino acid adenylation domain-containing protein
MTDKDPVEDIYNLTPLQQGMLFHGLYAADSGVYWEQLAVTLGAGLDRAAFRLAWRDAIARHGALRTHFHWEELDEPLQVVRTDIEMPWREEDWRALAPAEFDIKFRALLEEDRRQGYDFAKPPLMRFYLIAGPADRFSFVWCHHHILLDGWSGAIVFRDVSTLYEAHRRGESVRLPRPRPFRDHVLWLLDQDDGAAKAFWRAYLRGISGPPLASVQMGKPRPIPQRFRQDVRSLPKDAAEHLRIFARRERLTLNVIVQGAWALLLSHYGGAFDVVFGTTVSGRPPDLGGAGDMVGLFINTVPVRVLLDPQMEVLAWLHGLQAAQTERSGFEHLSLAEIQACSGLAADLPLFDSILSVETFPVDALLGGGESSLRIDRVDAFEQTNYPLATVVSPADDALSLKITADADRFDAANLARMLEHFAALLTSLADHPTARLTDLTLEPAARLPAQARDPRLDGGGVHRRVEGWAERTPDAVAVIGDAGSLTYRDLNARANRLSKSLRGQGIGPEALVGICADRSPAMVVALLGVLKAGGAYLPLDPGYPLERLRFMAADAGISLLLTDSSALGTAMLADLPAVRRLDIEGLDEHAADQAGDDLPETAITAETLAYVIYTSGSTGRPKGVMIDHGALLNHMQWMIGAFSFDHTVRVFQKTPFSFDASVWEFFLPLMCGGTLVLARPDGHQDPDYLVKTIRDRRVTVLQAVPSLLGHLAEHEAFGACETLTHVFSGGEALTAALSRRLQQRVPAILCNLYGPTEACIDATFQICARDGDMAASGDVPIGQPITNNFVQIRDAWGHPAPAGGAGELWIGGHGLARGYRNRADLTAQKFGAAPDGAGRVYRTGDLVRQQSDGTLHFLGRIDEQVKLRGYRIELGEIETVLERHPDIARAAVMLREDRPGQQSLAAFVTVRAGRADIADALRDLARQALPNYMVPAHYVVLDELPQTPSGKLDRRALSSWQPPSVSPADHAAPKSETERQVASVWESVLKLTALGIHDNFFQLGGHSLTAVQVVSRLREAFEVSIPLAVLFDLPTVSGLAGWIEACRTAKSGPPEADGDFEEISL